MNLLGLFLLVLVIVMVMMTVMMMVIVAWEWQQDLQNSPLKPLPIVPPPRPPQGAPYICLFVNIVKNHQNRPFVVFCWAFTCCALVGTGRSLVFFPLAASLPTIACIWHNHNHNLTNTQSHNHTITQSHKHTNTGSWGGVIQLTQLRQRCYFLISIIGYYI